MVKRKRETRENNDLQNTTQKPKDHLDFLGPEDF
jgi:hypothetical protein